MKNQTQAWNTTPHDYSSLENWERAKNVVARAYNTADLTYYCTDADAEHMVGDIRNIGGALLQSQFNIRELSRDPNYLGQWQGVQVFRGAAEGFFGAPTFECHKKTPDEIAAGKAAEEAKPLNPLKVAKGLIEDAQNTGTHDRVLLLQEARAWLELSKEIQP